LIKNNDIGKAGYTPLAKKTYDDLEEVMAKSNRLVRLFKMEPNSRIKEVGSWEKDFRALGGWWFPFIF